MKLVKRLAVLMMTLLLCYALAATAYAHDVPDASRTGSIRLTMTFEGKAVGGGELTLYPVGDVAEDDGNYSFVLAESVRDSGVTLTDLEDAATAQALADYVSEHAINGRLQAIGSDGRVTFDHLPLGLYLMVQTKAADGYAPITPFLVSVPMLEEGSYLYDVDASPKMETMRKYPPEPVNPTETTTQAMLPQTGQLNWPVPVLTLAGLLLFVTGWYLRFGKRKVHGA